VLVVQRQCCQTRKVGILTSQCCCVICLTTAHATALCNGTGLLVAQPLSRQEDKLRAACRHLHWLHSCPGRGRGEDGASVESSTSLLVWICLLLGTAGFFPLGAHLSNPQRARGF